MKYEPGFPKQLRHPQNMPARIIDTSKGGDNFQTGAERFPPVTVMTPEQEEDYRARGYLAPGESPRVQTSAVEYPKMLAHPLHVDKIPAKVEGRIVGGTYNPDAQQMVGGHIETYPVPEVPEKYPHVTVNNAVEEDMWAERGYRPNGFWDEAALERAHHMPGEPYTPQEWPKWVNGEVVHDPYKLTAAQQKALDHEYPKMVGDRVVANAAEELEARRALDLPNGERPVLAGAVAPVAMPGDAAHTAPAPSGEVSMLLKMIEQMRDELQDLRAMRNERVAHEPNAKLNGEPLAMLDSAAEIGRHLEPSLTKAQKKKRTPMSAERRAEVGRRFAEGKARKRAEREASADSA